MSAVKPPSPPYVGPPKWHGSARNKPIRRIVLHCTAGAEPGVKGAARATAAYTKRTDRPSSWHYCADSRESVQLTYDSVIAYHDGTNRNSLGYELSCSLSDEGRGHWTDKPHQSMLKIAARDVAQLCLAYDVPIKKLSPADLRADKRGLCGHVDMRDAFGATSHWDPGPHFPWAAFVGMVQAEADRLTASEPTTSTLTGVFAALRYDADPADRIAYLVAAVTERDADHLTADEAQGIRRRALRRALGPEWAVRRRGEYVTAWKRDRLTARGLGRLAQITAIPGLADWRNTRTFKKPLRDVVTGRPILVHVAHYPAGVEYGDTYRTDAAYAAQVAASRAALDKVGRGVKRRAKRRPDLVQIITGDFNLDQHRQAWADLMARTIGAPSVFTARLPKGGDHAGGRLISNAFISGARVTEAGLIKATRPEGLDHKAIWWRLTIDPTTKED